MAKKASPGTEDKIPGDDFSERMKRLRLAAGIGMSLLSSETGFTEKYLESVESGAAAPTPAAIMQISRALTADAGDYLPVAPSRTADAGDSFLKRKKTHSYKTLTPDAGRKHIKVFLVTIQPESEHGGVEYQHEGEEFIYVLEGEIEVQLGQKIELVPEGGSLHFNSALTHKMRNPGKKRTKVLAVIYTP